MFQQAEEALQCLQPVAIAFDAVQSDLVTFADNFEIWKNLRAKFRNAEKLAARECLKSSN